MPFSRPIGVCHATSGSASLGAVRGAITVFALGWALGWASSTAAQTLSITGVTLAEGNSLGAVGRTDFVFILSLSAPAAGDVDVSYDILAGGGPFPANPSVDLDLGAVKDTLPIPAGELQASITVPVVADLDFENAEFFVVELHDPVNATLAVASVGTGVILNDDLYVTLSGAEVVEGNVGATSAVFGVGLAGCASPPCVPDFDVVIEASSMENVPASATAGVDFQASSVELVFPAGVPATGTGLSVDVIGDVVWEPTETFRVQLVDVSGATGIGFSALGTILNDDAPAAAVPLAGWVAALTGLLLAGSGARVARRGLR